MIEQIQNNEKSIFMFIFYIAFFFTYLILLFWIFLKFAGWDLP